MCKAVVLSALAVCALSSLHAHAELPIVYSISGQAAHINIKASDERLAPNVFQLRGKIAATEGMLAGIGLVGLIGTPINDAQKHGKISMDITQQSAAYISLSNPEAESDELRFTVLLGYASTEIDTTAIKVGSSYSDTFSDFSYGFTLQDKIIASQPLYWSLDCASYYRDADLRIEGCGLGVNYEF